MGDKVRKKYGQLNSTGLIEEYDSPIKILRDESSFPSLLLITACGQALYGVCVISLICTTFFFQSPTNIRAYRCMNLIASTRLYFSNSNSNIIKRKLYMGKEFI